MLWVFYLARRDLGETYEKQQAAVSRTNETLEAALSGIRIVKAFDAGAGQERRLGEILRDRIGIQLRLARLVASCTSATTSRAASGRWSSSPWEGRW